MPPAAKTTERLNRNFGLFRSYGYNLRVGHAKKSVEAFALGLPLAAFDDKGSFDSGNGGDEPDLCGFQQFSKPLTLGFIEENGENGRSIDHHIPFSS